MTAVVAPPLFAPLRASRLGVFGPNWFAMVMGTGIIANAAALLPAAVPGLLTVVRGVWLINVALLLVLVLATARQWWEEPVVARGHFSDPVMGWFYGAPAMALMTVGAGALLVGVPVVGLDAAVGIDAVLWTAGTVLGLWTAVAVPLRSFSHRRAPEAAFGGWLMPVVPPMVSAATGPLLIPHLPEGQWRLAMQLACSAMFGMSLLASVVVITLVWARLMRHGPGPAALVPTYFIVLGPLGQSVTAGVALGATGLVVLPAPYGEAVQAFGLVYGMPVWGFAMLWLTVVAGLTARTVWTSGLPFTMAWWSFTFPVGTVVTGTSGLAVVTGSVVMEVAAWLLYVALVLAWGTVAVRTVRALVGGQLPRAAG